MRLRSFHPESSQAKQNQSAFTLIEVMISAVAGVLILGSMVSVFFFMNRSLNAMGNYEELDRQSRNALDTMSRDIRQTACLTSLTTNTSGYITALGFTNKDGTVLSYNWDGTNFLTYTNGDTQSGGTLLSNCTSLRFDVYMHTPSNHTTMTFWPVGNNSVNLGKVIVINWICSRTNFGSLDNTESVQTAKVVLRN